MFRNKVVLITLLFIIFFGFLLRQKSQTSFLLYPDSYRYLWQAEGLFKDQSVALEQGNTHLGYSFLSAITGFFTKNIESAARSVSFAAGVLAIPLIYLLAQEIFQSKKIGILASLFLASSFNHSVWSGFILSETAAIFFLLLAWVLLKKEKPFWAGLAQVVSISCRVEYALLVLPALAFFLFRRLQGDFDRREIFTYFFTYFLGLGLPFLILVRITDIDGFFFKNGFPYPLAIILCFFLSALCFSKSKGWLIKIAQLAPFALLAYSVFLIPFRATNNLLPWDIRVLKGWGDFMLSDPLLVLLGLAGLSLVISKKPRVGFFFLASTMPLFLVYQQANPIMHRYLVHFTPILALSAGYFTVKFFQWLHSTSKRIRPVFFNPAFSLIICFFLFGFLLPIKLVSADWHPEENYERLVAYRVEKIIQSRNLKETTVLVTFSVAPYAFYTKLPVLRIAKTNSFIETDLLNEKESVLVVVDEAVRDQRPEFVQWAEENLESFLIEKSFINLLYFYADYSYYPERSMDVYLLPTIELEDLLT